MLYLTTLQYDESCHKKIAQTRKDYLNFKLLILLIKNISNVINYRHLNLDCNFMVSHI